MEDITEKTMESAKAEEKRKPSRKSLERCHRLYADHEKTKQKLEALKAQVQKMECSFSPRITRKAKRLSKEGPEENRFERLHQTAARFEAKKQAKREVLDPECKFSPQISRKAQRFAKQEKSDGQHRFERLYKTAEKQREVLNQRRAQQGKEFSFSPTLVARKKSKGTGKLYPGKQALEEEREKREKKKEQIEMRFCTFRPARIKTSFDSSRFEGRYVPLDKRSDQILARKEARLAELRQAVEREQRALCSFSPATKWKDNAPISSKPIVLSKTEAEELSRRLHSEADRIEAKRKLLTQSWHFVEMHQGFLGKIDQHLSRWNMDRISFLHEKGKATVAAKLAKAKDPNRKHSLDVQREIQDLKESTFAPRINEASKRMDPFALANGEHGGGPGSPRFIRLYNYRKILKERHEKRVEETNAEIDKLANTAFTALSPTFRKLRKRFTSEEETMRLYEDARRIEERRERLYFDMNKTAREKTNMRFSALTISQVDEEIRSTGRLSPENILSPRSRQDQEYNLKILHDRHDRKLKAMEQVKDLVEKTKEWKATMKFSAHNINKTEEVLATSPTYDFDQTKKLWSAAKPSHDMEQLRPPSPRRRKPASPTPLSEQPHQRHADDLCAAEAKNFAPMSIPVPAPLPERATPPANSGDSVDVESTEQEKEMLTFSEIYGMDHCSQELEELNHVRKKILGLEAKARSTALGAVSRVSPEREATPLTVSETNRREQQQAQDGCVSVSDTSAQAILQEKSLETHEVEEEAGEPKVDDDKPSQVEESGEDESSEDESGEDESGEDESNEEEEEEDEEEEEEVEEEEEEELEVEDESVEYVEEVVWVTDSEADDAASSVLDEGSKSSSESEASEQSEESEVKCSSIDGVQDLPSSGPLIHHASFATITDEDLDDDLPPLVEKTKDHKTKKDHVKTTVMEEKGEDDLSSLGSLDLEDFSDNDDDLLALLE